MPTLLYNESPAGDYQTNFRLVSDLRCGADFLLKHLHLFVTYWVVCFYFYQLIKTQLSPTLRWMLRLDTAK